MASRLTRWSAVTVLALGASLAILLPPDASPFAAWEEYRPRVPTNALDAAVEANRIALSDAQFGLRQLRDSAALAPFHHSSKSPVVMLSGSDSMRSDGPLTAEAEALFRSVPRHRDAPRTLLIVTDQFRQHPADVGERGLCVAWLAPHDRWWWQGSPVRAGAGECLLATEFGPPGRGLAGWLRSTGSFEIPDAVPRRDAPGLVVTPAYDQLFERTAWNSYRLPWWSSTLVESCTVGRSASCVEALGFGPRGADTLWNWKATTYERLLYAAVPARLLSDLGPDRFAAVWRSDDPLPVSYARVSGRPFADWAREYVQWRGGRMEKENALTLAGWAGWVLWMGLFVGWFAVRIRTQGAQ